MTRIEVRHAAGCYAVTVEEGLIDRAGAVIAPLLARPKIFVFTDSNVAEHHLARLAASLHAARIDQETKIVAPGEASKDWPTLIALTEWLAERGIERSDTILALGGGVVGDLAGFAAAIVKRGCPWIAIPTTLVAAVDSAVGGKTGINLVAGKNLAGAFHQPRAVLVDPTALATLPQRERRAGYAEIVKYGLIDDPDLFAWCEANGAAIIAGVGNRTREAIERCIAAKARIVSADEREERGARILLNLGHSFAHALEAESGLTGGLLHGEAVAIGMTLAFTLSAERGLCTPQDAARVASHLASAGLPTRIADAGLAGRADALAGWMMGDKKAAGGSVTLILARAIGRAFAAAGFTRGELSAFLREAD